MKTVILAGGFGTRLEEETVGMPKPLIHVGEYPILWHIMKIYHNYGFNDFIICLGYKGYRIKEYFANYFLHQSDVTYDFSHEDQNVVFHNKHVESWKITLVDTGLHTQTGGRIKRIKPYLNDSPFMLTYGDTLANVNIKGLVDYHLSHQKMATVTAVQPPGKWGSLNLGENGQVFQFNEKPAGDGGWINGGFFVLNMDVFDYLEEGDKTVWEWSPLEKLASDGQLMYYRHTQFWKCMDTLRDKRELEKLWSSDNPPWKEWKES